MTNLFILQNAPAVAQHMISSIRYNIASSLFSKHYKTVIIIPEHTLIFKVPFLKMKRFFPQNLSCPWNKFQTVHFFSVLVELERKKLFSSTIGPLVCWNSNRQVVLTSLYFMIDSKTMSSLKRSTHAVCFLMCVSRQLDPQLDVLGVPK